jgi:hypothetical protein
MSKQKQNNKRKAPIVFFAYNRPEHTRLALESLLQCEGAVDSELFIYSDGAAGAGNTKKVQEVRKIVRMKRWCKDVHIIERDENLGLALSILQGVSEIVNRYGNIIVLEDDLIISPQFLNFMNAALEIYKDIPEVMHISGYMFPVKGNLPETFFYRAASCWGWATWKRAWEKFDPDAKRLLSEIRNRGMRRQFDIEGSADYYKMLQKQANGKLDSWAIRWYASVFLHKGLCLHPGISLVNNIGHDGTGVHCASTHAFTVRLGNQKVSKYKMEIKEDEDVVEKMESFYRKLRKPFYIRLLLEFMEFINK